MAGGRKLGIWYGPALISVFGLLVALFFPSVTAVVVFGLAWIAAYPVGRLLLDGGTSAAVRSGTEIDSERYRRNALLLRVMAIDGFAIVAIAIGRQLA